MKKYICIQRINNYKVGDIVDTTPSNINEITRILNMNSAHCTYWVTLDESNIAYFDIEGEEPIHRLKERLQTNMVPVTGFGYPFSICRCKLSQEDYAVIMHVGHFYHEKEPVGADCPWVTNEWNQFVNRYRQGQNWGEIREILKKLNEITGSHFRLPTIKECEFLNEHKNEEIGFKLENELCLAGSNYLCTDEKRIYVSDPMYDDHPPYKSFRLVECEISLSEINYADMEVLRKIDKSMHSISEDMHYWWEN